MQTIIGTSNVDIEALARELGQALLARGWHVTCAESCTGGGVAAAITSIPGSSSWFEVGLVTYSNRHKQQLLNVGESSLTNYGAVSEQVVTEMAAGALKITGADIAVAISGIAGPDGGTPDKPVGTVWFAWATNEQMYTEQRLFAGSRNAVQRQAVVAALRGLILHTNTTG